MLIEYSAGGGGGYGIMVALHWEWSGLDVGWVGVVFGLDIDKHFLVLRDEC